MMSADFGKAGEKSVRCPYCEEFSKVKKWQLVGKAGQYFYCPKCKAALTKKEFLNLGTGIMAFAKQQKPAEKHANECPCKACELDCDRNIGTVNCALERE